MTTARAVQVSLFPDVAPDRPTGPILPSVIAGTNADLMAAVAPYYLTGSVLDVTYGEGAWWRRFKPATFTAHDLYKLDGVDFRALPELDRSVDAVAFDPPYVPQGGDSSSTVPRFLGAFGLEYRSRRDMRALIAAGLAECARVSRRWVLVKCCDYVSSGQFTLGHLEVLELAAALELKVHDLLVHHTGSGPGGHNIFEPARARRHHSYLIVFKVRAG